LTFIPALAKIKKSFSFSDLEKQTEKLSNEFSARTCSTTHGG